MKEHLSKIMNGENLERDEAADAMGAIMSGDMPSGMIAGFLVALRMKGESPEELTGFAEAMLARATPVELSGGTIVDMCGTGGDGKGTFNISTLASFVVAGVGVKVAKHGNRSVSSKCGSADLLSTMGVNIEMPVENLGGCVDEVGIGFLFAPMLHPAMKHAVQPRKELGVRTVFNLLGPMVNPARPTAQVMGVYDFSIAPSSAEVISNLGVERALIVHGSDGLDEITLTGPTRAIELRKGSRTEIEITPESFGLGKVSLDEITGAGGPEECAIIADAVLSGKPGAHREMVVANAAAGIYVAGLVDSLKDAAKVAEEVIDSGSALEKLTALKEFTAAT